MRAENGSAGNRRRRRLLTRLMPLVLVAAAALAAGLLLGARRGGQERSLARRYAAAWARSQFPAMYALLDLSSRRALSEAAFEHAYRAAARTATLAGLRLLRVGSWRGGSVPVLMAARTRLFGSLVAAVALPIAAGGSGPGVHFTPALVFPGLAVGERLTRHTMLRPRAALLADDGTPLAEGPRRTSAIPDVAAAIAGVLGPIPRGRLQAYLAAGYPPHARVGRDGLERIFEHRLAGEPGGTLLAGRRILASRSPLPGDSVRTTIDPSIERAIIAAMAGRYAGVVALDPRDGAVLGAAGVAFSGLQPPGSTMKIVTSTGVLEAGLAHLGDVFPVQSQVAVDGFPLHNANGEACGGTLLSAFAVSCNSVFAPLGVRLGAERFLSVAKRFGFNEASPIAGAPASMVPPARVRGSALELAASAIGQGEVQATALEMADVAAAIAMDGRRPVPTLLAGAPGRYVSVTTPQVAALVQRMMVAVVTSPGGTGGAAAIPGVVVAGKTGTAELQTTVDPLLSNPANTDAWFVGYAPVGAPRIVVGALFPGQGSGAATAAPAAHDVLVAGLRR